MEKVSSDETDSEEGRWNPYERSKGPSDMKKVAWAWERHALSAEESLRQYKGGLMDRTGEGKLKGTLSFLLNSYQTYKDKESKSTWNARAFDTIVKLRERAPLFGTGWRVAPCSKALSLRDSLVD